MIVAAGSGASKHFSSYHRLLSTASSSLDAMGLAVFTIIGPFLGDAVMLGLDDTLARKRGLRMFGTGMHHDPLSSTRGLAFVRWGHSWVVLGVIVDFPFRPGHWIFLPLLFRLYVNRQTVAKHGGHYRTRPELGVEMLHILCAAHENRRFHVVADSAYGGQNVLAKLPGNCDLTSRLLLAARLYDTRPERVPGTNGRPRKRGQRLPSANDMLEGRCRRVSLSIYGRSYRSRITDQVARVFAVPDRPLRVVASEALEGGRGKEAFYSTRHEATAEQVICWYAMRWSLEVTFRDSKQCLGFEEPQGWSRKAVERTAPLAMLLHTLVVLWLAKEGHRLGSLRLTAGIPARPTRRSVTCFARCDEQACDSTFWRWRRPAGVPESWPGSWNTRSPWRRDDDGLRPSRACFLAESGWSWEGVPMP